MEPTRTLNEGGNGCLIFILAPFLAVGLFVIAAQFDLFGPPLPDIAVSQCSDEWEEVVEQVHNNGFDAFDKYGWGRGSLVGFHLSGGAVKVGEYEGKSAVSFSYLGTNTSSRSPIRGEFIQWVDHNSCAVAWD